MRKTKIAVAGLAGVVLGMLSIQAPAVAAPPVDDGSTGSAAAVRQDNRPGPRSKELVERRKAAIDKVAKGQAKANDDGVVQLAPDKFAEIETVKQDKIFTVLAEFGDQGSGRYGTAPGPLHNTIAKPDRSVDNTTLWTSDFSPAYYEELFNGSGESMKGYYEAVSNNAYSVTNTVTDWVKVPNNGSFYGDNATEDTGGAWAFVRDSGNAWWDSQVAAGKTPAEIDAYLAQFDVWDRYDFNNNGNFDEPDGYIDHFQAVHAGEGEEGGGGALGEDAIWSHRWYAFGNQFGSTGPDGNLAGGTRIGSSKYWLGDYTTEPENGGVGVFAHEFGHDLGLPDFYDTSGAATNSTAFWTLMSSGSWLGHGSAANEGIGTTPGLMGPEEKRFLGWLDHSEVGLGTSGDFVLNPSQLQIDGKDQAVRVNLPDKTTTTSYTVPSSGTTAWWTGSADNLNDSLTHAVPAQSRVTVTANVWYDIEANYDYLYGEYSTDGGNTWQSAGRPLSGSAAWGQVRYSYDAGGLESLFRFRYQTDGGVHNPGAFIDDVKISAGKTVILSDDVESGAGKWTAEEPWQLSTGSVTKTTPQYYLVENREYVGFDATLAEGPYAFTRGISAPNWVDFFKYQNGMLVWYIDESYADNNVSAHPGAGLALPVDARPAPFKWSDGTMPGNSRQPFDATFGLEATDPLCIAKEVQSGTKRTQEVSSLDACAVSSAAISVFKDIDPLAYYSADNPYGSVKVAGHGVEISVTSDAGSDLGIRVVNPARK
ncbi:immune inhibitor A domain-containing protein [Arthrobacter sp. B10-11]|uniref:immune inhibitor A domain-containing protein n=1 Tax=Arthrobacter sp. B10-11 TaxID=3081160 RepID=UPI0029552B94|nr:immune inhibitor A domain-containing protein [Arthrobacter sp. B10-11]MDV8147903.1 immune inhibitor A [Arthrobacter sp. B10-11]